MFKSLQKCFATIRRKIERVSRLNGAVVAVTASEAAQLSLRVLAIQEGWRILFARTLESALQLRDASSIVVILYDQNLPNADWRTSLSALVQSSKPVFFILLCPVPQDRVWRSVLDGGGFAVSRWPVGADHVTAIVNEAFALAAAVDECPAALDSRPLDISERRPQTHSR